MVSAVGRDEVLDPGMDDADEVVRRPQDEARVLGLARLRALFDVDRPTQLDGLADLLVGAEHGDAGGADFGAAYLVFGGGY